MTGRINQIGDLTRRETVGGRRNKKRGVEEKGRYGGLTEKNLSG